ncbi:MAG: transposase [Phycisphaerae bacterium]|jgi:REP element-mobilizing transposase RayT
MTQPLAYFLTWTTYGSWLPGDRRGWVHHSDGAWHVPIREGDNRILGSAIHAMSGPSVILSQEQRDRVSSTIQACCKTRNWGLHAINVRSNHVHVVVCAADYSPERVMGYFKTWASRTLNGLASPGAKGPWWTRHGSTRYINAPESLQKAIDYVVHQ